MGGGAAALTEEIYMDVKIAHTNASGEIQTIKEQNIPWAMAVAGRHSGLMAGYSIITNGLGLRFGKKAADSSVPVHGMVIYHQLVVR